MKLPVIRLIDLGYDDDFAKSMNFAQSMIDSINVGDPKAEVEFIRTADFQLIAHALTVPARLIHLMAHGDKTDPTELRFGAKNTAGEIDAKRSIELFKLAEYLQEAGEGIEATAVFVDACSSAQAKFTKVLRNSLERPIVYIGSTRTVYWHECTTFDSILYGSMLRRKGAGFDDAAWVWNAALMSIDAYQKAVDGPCPFRVLTLTPSAAAKKAFANAKAGRGLG